MVIRLDASEQPDMPRIRPLPVSVARRTASVPGCAGSRLMRFARLMRQSSSSRLSIRAVTQLDWPWYRDGRPGLLRGDEHRAARAGDGLGLAARREFNTDEPLVRDRRDPVGAENYVTWVDALRHAVSRGLADGAWRAGLVRAGVR